MNSKIPILEKRDTYREYEYVVLFQPMGFRCGYVKVPKNHKYYNVSYKGIPISCHGGLTYGRSYLATVETSDCWWVGFDCGHYRDGYDEKAYRNYYNEPISELLIINNFPPISLDSCIKECKDIIDQLISFE